MLLYRITYVHIHKKVNFQYMHKNKMKFGNFCYNNLNSVNQTSAINLHGLVRSLQCNSILFRFVWDEKLHFIRFPHSQPESEPCICRSDHHQPRLRTEKLKLHIENIYDFIIIIFFFSKYKKKFKKKYKNHFMAPWRLAWFINNYIKVKFIIIIISISLLIHENNP